MIGIQFIVRKSVDGFVVSGVRALTWLLISRDTMTGNIHSEWKSSILCFQFQKLCANNEIVITQKFQSRFQDIERFIPNLYKFRQCEYPST
jgi:hypothetical protein